MESVFEFVSVDYIHTRAHGLRSLDQCITGKDERSSPHSITPGKAWVQERGFGWKYEARYSYVADGPGTAEFSVNKSFPPISLSTL